MSNQKGTALVGGALSDEAMASSESVHKTDKGLQQFYSPKELAQLVRKVIGGSISALDLTAGDGSLLAGLDPPHSYGVEVDKDQIRNAEGSYHAIHGDIQQVYTLLKLGMPGWDAVVCNPPFGLQWEDPTVRGGKPTESTKLTLIYASRLMNESGQLVFVCGRDRFYRALADMPEARGIYAVIEVTGRLFEDVGLPCVIAFGIHEGNRSAESQGYAKREFDLNTLDLAHSWVLEEREKALGRRNYVSTNSYGSYDFPKTFETIQTEHNRRTAKRLKTNREYDVLLVGGKLVQYLPSGFAIKALHQSGEYHTFYGLNGQNVNYFVSQERIWQRLMDQRDLGVITVEPKLCMLVEDLLAESRREVCPLYDIKPQQRLAYLQDQQYLTCKVADPERGFDAGESYRLDTKSQTVIVTEKRVVESKKNPGDYEEKTFEKQAKVLKVTIGHWTFLDSMADSASEDIQYCIDHFDIPDPGQVGTRHPDEIAALVKLANEVLDDFEVNSRKYEAKHAELTPFSRRDFQIEDIARLAFKGGGLLSWEQGLGKTLGGLLFAEMMVRLGAQDARMVIAPGDLIPQWEREMERFMGVKPTLIKPRPVNYTETGEDGVTVTKKTNGVHGQVVEINRHLRDGGTGLYLTYYEALTLAGVRGRNKLLPVVTVEEKVESRLVKGTNKYGNFYYVDDEVSSSTLSRTPAYEGQEAYANRADDTGALVTWYKRAVKPTKVWHARDDETIPLMPDGTFREIRQGYIPAQYEDYIVKITSKEVCPECRADMRNGWNGEYCAAEKADGSKCGYAHYATKIRPAVSYMSQAFRHGVVLMDELTMIQGDYAKRSIALRGLYAKHRLGMTGTPIKNFVAQAFWLLWWCLGNGSKRFGYEYEGGRTRFENDFSVIEWMKDGGKKQNRKALPEVTNLSILWRLLSSSVIRRRKEETGETLVPKYFHEVHVPLGMAQAELIDKMLKDFPKLFAEKYPESKIVAAGMQDIMAPLIGLNSKLDYGLTLPEADPDAEWWGVDGVTNWTPAALRTVELAMALAKQGRKVLVGSNLVATSKWIAEALEQKGVNALHILDEDGTTTNKDKRAKHVHAFQTDAVQVFCAGVKAIRLGHNLDQASAVILHGLDWDYETFDQFIARIHRLTSQKPIDVFVILPSLEGQDTLTTRKWSILTMKGQAANLALDGRLVERNEAVVDKAQIIRELVERGVTVTDEAVDEITVQELWEALPLFENYEAPVGLVPVPPEEVAEEETSCDLPLSLSTSPSVVPDLDAAAAMVLEKLAEEWSEADDQAVAELLDPDEAALEAELAAVEAEALGCPVNVKYQDEYDLAWTINDTMLAAPLGPDEFAGVEYADGSLGKWDGTKLVDVPVPPEPILPEAELAEDTLADGFTVDDVAVEMNAAEMPQPDAMALVMEQLAAMQRQLASLESKNAELESRLNTDEQLTLGLEV